jgi:glycosyltransferase involved in cell wall biosynthesis
MGSFMPYKNVETLISALEFLPNYELHLLSKINPKREKELVEMAPKDAQIEFYGGVTDQEYKELLSSAHALVTASKEEGFGLPIIEAMSIGVPVICSDIEIFHEVAGEAGVFFDPDSAEELSKQVRKLEKKSFRQNITKEGLAQARKFSWHTSAKALLKTMRQL